MTARAMKVVSPFRPFQPASREHQELGPFDWIGAIAMLRESVRRSCACETFALTDAETELPGPTIHVPVAERTHLMLWILEVSRAYLESDAFDCDTVFCSPDTLVFGDLRPWFAGDFGIVIRPGHDRPVLNGLQWWPLESRDKLIVLYKKAEKLARRLPEADLVWGADSLPFADLLEPLNAGIGYRKRAGLYANLVSSREVMLPLSSMMIAALDNGEGIPPVTPVVDFRFLRKHHMRRYFDATLGSAVSA